MNNGKSSLIRFVTNNWSLSLAMCTGSSLAHIATSTMPFQIGALMDGSKITSSQAGVFGLSEVGCLAVGMIVIAPFVGRMSSRTLATGSAVLAVVANLCLFFTRSFAIVLLCGGLAGLAFGCIFACTISSAARSDQADRLYAIGNGGSLILISAVITMLPTVILHAGVLGIFIAIASLTLIGSIFFLGFKRSMPAQKPTHSTSRIRGTTGLLLSWASFSAGTGAVYAFSERIGQSIRLTQESIGWVLSIGVFVGMIGTAVVVVIGNRINRSVAFVAGLLGSGASCLLIGYALDFYSFTMGVFVYWICYMFLYSYLLGTAALLDSSGRVGTLGGAMERLGYGVGVWIGGTLAEHANYSVTGLVGFAGCMLALIVGLPTLRRALKEHQHRSVTSAPER